MGWAPGVSKSASGGFALSVQDAFHLSRKLPRGEADMQLIGLGMAVLLVKTLGHFHISYQRVPAHPLTAHPTPALPAPFLGPLWISPRSRRSMLQSHGLCPYSDFVPLGDCYFFFFLSSYFKNICILVRYGNHFMYHSTIFK